MPSHRSASAELVRGLEHVRVDVLIVGEVPVVVPAAPSRRGPGPRNDLDVRHLLGRVLEKRGQHVTSPRGVQSLRQRMSASTAGDLLPGELPVAHCVGDVRQPRRRAGHLERTPEDVDWERLGHNDNSSVR